MTSHSCAANSNANAGRAPRRGRSPSAGRSDVCVDCADDVRLRTDPDHLRRIVVNYLTNAFKYGEAPIDVLVISTDEAVKLEVCDRGEGVPPEFVPRLFERFARADRTA